MKKRDRTRERGSAHQIDRANLFLPIRITRPRPFLSRLIRHNATTRGMEDARDFSLGEGGNGGRAFLIVACYVRKEGT